MNIREMNSVDQLQASREAWSDLLRHTPNANFFQTLDWLKVYWLAVSSAGLCGNS